jgi:hypothetical protein
MTRNAVAVMSAVVVCAAGLAAPRCESRETESVVVLSPMAGWIRNEVKFATPGSASEMSLKENGWLGGIYMMYADGNLTIGSLGHCSKLKESREDSYLFFARYYFLPQSLIRPMLAFDLDHISTNTPIPVQDAAPFASMDVDTSVWAIHPSVGVSCRFGLLRLVPFAGYFNERVGVTINTPGMRIANQLRNGFRADAGQVLDYVTLGSRLDLEYRHFIRWDGKFYFRFRRGDKALLTIRNRLDFLFSRSFGVTAKVDYFQDESESNLFAAIGPAFVF